MKLKVPLFLEGLSVAETGEHGILICEEIDVPNLCMLASVTSVPLYYGIQTMVSLMSSPRRQGDHVNSAADPYMPGFALAG